jgi:hypothetical protein
MRLIVHIPGILHDADYLKTTQTYSKAQSSNAPRLKRGKQMHLGKS